MFRNVQPGVDNPSCVSQFEPDCSSGNNRNGNRENLRPPGVQSLFRNTTSLVFPLPARSARLKKKKKSLTSLYCGWCFCAFHSSLSEGTTSVLRTTRRVCSNATLVCVRNPGIIPTTYVVKTNKQTGVRGREEGNKEERRGKEEGSLNTRGNRWVKTLLSCRRPTSRPLRLWLSSASQVQRIIPKLWALPASTSFFSRSLPLTKSLTSLYCGWCFRAFHSSLSEDDVSFEDDVFGVELFF